MFSVEEFQEQLRRWRDLEREALAAEERLQAAGQLGASPEAAALAREAAGRRRAADDYLSALLGAVRNHPPASNDDGDEAGRKQT